MQIWSCDFPAQDKSKLFRIVDKAFYDLGPTYVPGLIYSFILSFNKYILTLVWLLRRQEMNKTDEVGFLAFGLFPHPTHTPLHHKKWGAGAQRSIFFRAYLQHLNQCLVQSRAHRNICGYERMNEWMNHIFYSTTDSPNVSKLSGPHSL